MTQLTTADLHPALGEPTLRSMSFLNEIAERYPGAISLAAGRPHEAYYDVADIPRYLESFVQYATGTKGVSPAEVQRMLFQYGPTKGIITDLLARHLLVDEGVDVAPESIVTTVGCQEAMLITLMALRTGDRDVVLAADPTYVGLSGAAALVNLPVVPVRNTPHGIDLAHLVTQVRAVEAAGQRARAFYVVPDFANPSGTTIGINEREELLAVAQEHDLLVLEDNPYRLFGDSDERTPTLKALDDTRQVVSLGSLSKSAFPGVRIGYVVADQLVAYPDRPPGFLADELANIKSMVTVNTSPLAQAIAGGLLIEHGFSLASKNDREIDLYRRNRHLLLEHLSRAFEAHNPKLASWNAPDGGFFVVVDVPFEANHQALERCASEYGVLWTPLQDFYIDGGGVHQLRLSCSALEPHEIVAGVERLARFVRHAAAA